MTAARLCHCQLHCSDWTWSLSPTTLEMPTLFWCWMGTGKAAAGVLGARVKWLHAIPGSELPSTNIPPAAVAAIAVLPVPRRRRCPLGHLPHVVTRHLAPLMRSSQVWGSQGAVGWSGGYRVAAAARKRTHSAAPGTFKAA